MKIMTKTRSYQVDDVVVKTITCKWLHCDAFKLSSSKQVERRSMKVFAMNFTYDLEYI